MAATTSSDANEECDICEGAHRNFQCSSLKELTVPQRVEKARSLGLCFNCLRKGHRLNNCPSNGKCLKCRRRHHTQLHDDSNSGTFQVENPNQSSAHPITAIAEGRPGPVNAVEEFSERVATACSINNGSTKRTVVLLTAVVTCIDQQGRPHMCRVLLDCGSQVNLISKKMANNIGASIFPTNVRIAGVNNKTSDSMEKTTVEIRSRCNDFRTTLECFVTSSVTGVIPSSNIDVTTWHIPPGLQLADPDFNTPQKIDMLIGNGLFFKILQSGQLKLSDHLPELRETLLGWVFAGAFEEAFNSQQDPSYSHPVTVEDVYDAVQKFWTIEEVPGSQAESSEEEACEEHFRSTHHRNSDGRFIVQLPLKENADLLDDCRSVALKRFFLLEQRLARNPQLRAQYIAFIREYEHLGHCKQIAERNDPPNLQKFYLPHHAVLRPDSSSTKCRVVFDASAKSSRDTLSLNDVLKVGGTVQSDLFSIVLRFRKHQFAFTADISKMYRQILVDKSQTSLQRIFWRESPGEVLKVYELSTVTYGTASAPFLATRSMVQLADDEKTKFPLGASTVTEDFYVDDMLSGDDCLESAMERQEQVKGLLASGGFQIHKWCSNSKELLAQIPATEREQQKVLEEQGVNAAIKVLGIMWEPQRDEFLFVSKISASCKASLPVTKRIILSEIAKLFDPLGFVSPVIVLAKLLMQRMWRSKVGWDEPVERAIEDQWSKLMGALSSINLIKIPRHVTVSGAVSYELHGFSDASQSAYGACVYIRSILPDGTAQMHLLCSKSKVAPLKEITIPRLELCAALLLSRLVTKVLNTMKMKFQQILLLSDSQIFLAWLKKLPEQLQVFVRHRIDEINRTTHDYIWLYIRSQLNPADIVSRGQMPCELAQNALWWHGPAFLACATFEPMIITTIADDDLPDLKMSSTALPVIKLEQLKVFSRYSSFRKLQRVMSLVMRFINNCRYKDRSKRVCNPVPTIREMRQALQLIVKVAQYAELYEEIVRVQTGRVCRKISALSPILVNGVLRVGGRLKHSQLPFVSKHQMILPKKNPITHLLIRALHEEHLHMGPSGLVHVLRREFWVIDAASTVRVVTRSCVQCFRVQPTDITQYLSICLHGYKSCAFGAGIRHDFECVPCCPSKICQPTWNRSPTTFG